MAKKFNLAEFLPEGVSKSDPSQVVEIPLHKIIANGRNLYGVRGVEDLADSIKLNGLLEPLIVYPYGSAAGLYRVISGHRRLAALQLNKAETAPCRVVDPPRSAAWEDLQIISANAQRVKTGAEIAAEAERMTKALIQLRKDGAELPGRLRDLVADALGTSSTSLARKKVIDKQLKVPGFRQAWKDGKMGESVAYELARILPEENQYKALDMLIDEGVDYAKADIKTVQRIKKRIEAGESTKQDLHAEAEKRGIQIRDENFSPLLAALVREAIPSWERWDVLECPTKAAGVDLLHQFGLTHHSSSGGAIWFDSDPQALTITRPVRVRLKWAEVWELIALDSMGQQAREAEKAGKDPSPAAQDDKVKTAQDDKGGGPAGAPAPTEKAAPEGWQKCGRGDPPAEGQLVCLMMDDGDGVEDWFARVAVYRGGKYVEFGWETVTVDVEPGAVWTPLPGGWKEAAK